MKLNFYKILAKLASSVAMLVTLCAISNINSTCIFMTYQPDVPEDLT